MTNEIEIITLRSGDLCARDAKGNHIAIAQVATHAISPAFTPEALRRKAEAYRLLADAVEAGWDMWEGYRKNEREVLAAFSARLLRKADR
ncbi:hypothetical protein QSJ18_18315 [Gordonia sp. ABSL1-1]|uniref:hypothetical protein n=1 Tax=Gordonia sp. ABSL1-1 TaxID=3053923 RepID=UPI002572FD6A|nr:hypothetical protein [Gordonia sp. ABSL1-1]MDL9938705.1 hypothetical protein [Gordonia sp. ABSL1-1]